MVALVRGELDWADALFLIAAIVLFIAGLVRFQRRDYGGACVCAGLILVAVGLLVL